MLSDVDETHPALVLSCAAAVPEDVIRPFVEAASEAGLLVDVKRRESGGIYASPEWFTPTTVVLSIIGTAALSEVVKKVVGVLWDKLFGPNRTVRTTVLASSPGKAPLESEYSRNFSVMAVIHQRRIKLLVRDAATREEYDAAVLAFSESMESKASLLQEARPSSGFVFVTYDPDTRALRVLDPRTRAPQKVTDDAKK